MQVFLIIILIFALIWLFFGRYIRVWLQNAMLRRFENLMRHAMGMPSLKEEKKMRNKKHRHSHSKSDYRSDRKRNDYSDYGHHGPQTVRPDSIIPKEYAEDVEFVEFKDFSETASFSDSDSRSSANIKIEEQVSDVEYVEIKK